MDCNDIEDGKGRDSRGNCLGYRYPSFYVGLYVMASCYI